MIWHFLQRGIGKNLGHAAWVLKFTQRFSMSIDEGIAQISDCVCFLEVYLHKKLHRLHNVLKIHCVVLSE